MRTHPRDTILNGVFAALILVTAWRLFGPTVSALPAWKPNAPAIQPGARVNLPGVEWAADQGVTETLVLFAVSTCPACRQSLQFYSALAAATASRKEWRFVVASSEPRDAAAKWLRENGVAASQVISVDDPEMHGFFSTPTLIHAGADGRVLSVVVGKLSADDERHVLAVVTGQSGGALPNNVPPEIPDAECEGVKRAGNVRVLDVRDRDEYQTREDGVTYIPLLELYTRAPIEVPRELKIFVRSTASASVRRSAGVALKRLGFGDVVVCRP